MIGSQRIGKSIGYSNIEFDILYCSYVPSTLYLLLYGLVAAICITEPALRAKLGYVFREGLDSETFGTSVCDPKLNLSLETTMHNARRKRDWPNGSRPYLFVISV